MPVRPLVVTLMALTTGGVTTLDAADFAEATITHDWYLSLGVADAPEVEEDTSGPGGDSTYGWRGLEDGAAPRLAIGYLTCSGGTSGGWALGIEGVFTTCDVTPGSYEVDGLRFGNTSDRSLRYSTLGVTVFGGYEFGINSDADTISSFLLIGPYLSGGGAYGDSEVRDQNGTYQSDSGVGWYVEGGLRAGFFITERRWLLGCFIDYGIGTSEVEIDFGGGAESTVIYDRQGLTGSLVVGYRP